MCQTWLSLAINLPQPVVLTLVHIFSLMQPFGMLQTKYEGRNEMGYCNHNMQPPQDSVCVWNKANNVLNAGLCGEQSVSAILLYFLPAICLSYVCMHIFLLHLQFIPSLANSPACCTSDWHGVSIGVSSFLLPLVH